MSQSKISDDLSAEIYERSLVYLDLRILERGLLGLVNRERGRRVLERIGSRLLGPLLEGNPD